MTKTNTPTEEQPAQIAVEKKVDETPYEAVASICSVLVVGLFILTFLGQNFVIPSGSMEKTLMVGDHLVVDRISVAPPTKWMPLVHYREPRRNDIIVFLKPGEPDLFLVKRLIGVPGDHIHLHDGIVFVNGVAEPQPPEGEVASSTGFNDPFLDEFPSIPPSPPGATESWAIDFPNHVVDGDLVIPPGRFFMMGDHRHDSLDSRYWGFVPRENIVGRPLFNYWSFKTPEHQYEETGIGSKVGWLGHVALHFFTETRWYRTLKLIR
jgi:signal peptidase I